MSTIKIEQNTTYQITNAVNGYGLLAGDWGMDPNNNWVHLFPLSNTGKNPDGFKWLLVPADNDSYWIINKVSGYGLLAGDWGMDPNNNWVHQFPLSNTGKNPNGFKWYIRETPDGSYKITNAVNGYGLLAGDWGMDPNNNWVHLFPLSNTGKNPDGFKWHIEKGGTLDFDLTTLTGTGDANKIGSIPKLTNSESLPPETSDPVVIGKSLIPFFAVNDVNNNPAFQVQNNPYYRIKREGYWKCIYTHRNDGGSKKTVKESVTVKEIETTSQTTEQTIGYQFSANAGFSAGGGIFSASASLGYQLNKDLKIAISKEAIHDTTHVLEITEVFPAGKPTLFVKWMRYDTYTISRLSGDVIAQVEVPNINQQFDDRYPDA